jgi:hypothetical protein
LEETVEGMMERERGWGRAYGGCCLFVQGGKLSNTKNTKIKYVVALDGRVTIFHMQQPTKKHASVTKETWGKRLNQRGDAGGGRYYIVLAAIKRQ